MIIAILILAGGHVHADLKPTGKLEATTCIDYNKPQDIHPTHYWDGKIHLVPVFDKTGKSFKGYVIVHLSKDSPFLSRNFAVGDVLTELDDVKAVISAPGEKENKFLAKIKTNSFKTARVERCQKIIFSY